jgi:hypothetical protein
MIVSTTLSPEENSAVMSHCELEGGANIIHSLPFPLTVMRPRPPTRVTLLGTIAQFEQVFFDLDQTCLLGCILCRLRS